MRRQLAVFFLLFTPLTFAQEIDDKKEAEADSNNTLEVLGFSVPVQVVDSLTVLNDSIASEVIQPISKKDSIRFLNFSLPKLGILKNVLIKIPKEEDVDSLPIQIPKQPVSAPMHTDTRPLCATDGSGKPINQCTA